MAIRNSLKKRVTTEELDQMGRRADKIIASWSLTSLAGNLLPPPFDSIAVGSSIAKMGWEIAKVYRVDIDLPELKRIGLILAKGLGAVAAASYIGSSVFKYVPGVNFWVALLMQPPIVGAMTYAAGQSYKQYFEIVLTDGKTLTDEQICKIAERAYLRRRKFV